MFRHFHAKSLEIAIQNSERLFNFSPRAPRIHAHGPTRPRAVGEYEYRLLNVIHGLTVSETHSPHMARLRGICNV